jgi:hypothetical protein
VHKCRAGVSSCFTGAVAARGHGFSEQNSCLATATLCLSSAICLVFGVDGCSNSILSYQIKKLEVLWFELLSFGSFLNAHSRCLVKCLLGYKLIFDLIFIVSLARVLSVSSRVSLTVPSPVPMADNLPIARRSLPS